MRTGILGGTFDPIHIAHLHAAECALDQLGLDRVLIMPAGDPWQKATSPITPAHHRLEMCRLATEGVDGLHVDDRELRREGATYTVDTLATFPDDEELYLVMGSDAAAGIRSWHRWEDVVGRAALVVAPRSGVPDADPQIAGTRHLDMGVLEVSATGVRALARGGHPFRYLVTRSVHDYIVSNHLYT